MLNSPILNNVQLHKESKGRVIILDILLIHSNLLIIQTDHIKKMINNA